MANLVERSPRRQVAPGTRCFIVSFFRRSNFSAVSGVAISLQLVNSLRRNRAVVQLGRTLEWGSRGRGFESRRPDVTNVSRIRTEKRKDRSPLRRFLRESRERLRRHNLGHSKATRHGVPWSLVHTEMFCHRADATRRERYYKSGRGRDELDQL